MMRLKRIIPLYIYNTAREIRHFFRKRFRIRLHASLVRCANKVAYLCADRKFLHAPAEKGSPIRRILKYNHSLLPNKYIADLERESCDIELDREKLKKLETGDSPGYPAWNLLYYSLITSLPGKGERKAVIVETGTNRAFSTIIMAQVLKDAGVQGCVYTADINEKWLPLAKENVEKAGLSEYVKFSAQDSLIFLNKLVREVEYIDFALLDGNHSYDYVRKEFSIIYPKISACRGKVYFDNTMMESVDRALYFIKHAYGGNMLEFKNCSWLTPGNAIWQPDW